MRFIVFYKGYPKLADELPTYDCRRIDLVERSWEWSHAFDDRHHYQLCVDDPPHVGRFGRLLTQLLFQVGYHPRTEIRPEWRKAGPFSQADVLAQFAKGLRTDDDLIQQWFNGDDVMKLVEAAEDFDELVLAIRCIKGAFEVDESALRYVERVVGPGWRPVESQM